MFRWVDGYKKIYECYNAIQYATLVNRQIGHQTATLRHIEPTQATNPNGMVSFDQKIISFLLNVAHTMPG